MWSIDLYNDWEWVKLNGKIMQPRFEGKLSFETAPEVHPKLQIFGSEYEIKHARILLDVTTKEDAEKFINFQLNKIQTSIEVFASIITGQPFRFKKVPGYHGILMIHSEFNADNPEPAQVTPQYAEPIKFNYKVLQHALGSQFPGLEKYLVYIQRGMDPTNEWDYRWINYYKVCELRFNASGRKIIHSHEWKEFLTHFSEKLKPYTKNKQKLEGLIEEWRVLAFHAIGEGGAINFGNPYDGSAAQRIIESLPIMEQISQKIINELPENTRGLRFFQIDRKEI